MIKEMNLKINNFGLINDADIELKKLNVIAGKNGSGKSTSSKLLSCFLMANSNEGYYLANKSIFDRFVAFIFNWDRKFSRSQSNVDESLAFRINVFENEKNLRKESFNQSMFIQLDNVKHILDDLNFPDKSTFLNELNGIEKLLNFNQNEQNRYFNVSSVLLNSEFNFDELMTYEANVTFYGKLKDCDFSYEIDFKHDKIGAKISKDYVNCLNFDDVIYIDSPSVFDYEEILRMNRNSSNHVDILSKQLNIIKNESDVYDDVVYEKIVKFQNRIKNIVNGQIYFDNKKEKFLFKKGDKIFSMKNTASGIKQMGIIQILLENRILKENSFLIMDGVRQDRASCSVVCSVGTQFLIPAVMGFPPLKL